MFTPGVNSLVTMEAANDYFSDRPRRGATWVAATDGEKKEALMYATAYLEQQVWVGGLSDPAQTLSWPRIYYDVRGTRYSNTPSQIQEAVYELALSSLQESLVEAPTSAPQVMKVAVGPVKVDFGGPKPIERPNPWVERLISPWLFRATGIRLVQV